jgi:hypothetical protein
LPKGTKHGDYEQGVDYLFREFFGSVKERILLFSAEVGVSTHWVAQRMAESLDPLGTRRAPGEMQHLRGGAGRKHPALAEMEVVVGALGDGKAPQLATQVQGDRRKEISQQKLKKKITAQGKKKKAGKDAAKQKIYAARHAARQKGLPLPDLPRP